MHPRPISNILDSVSADAMNPFDSALAAGLYSSGRPFVHPFIATQIRPHIPLKLERALDVACGTGLSTRILLEFADGVTGCDLSVAMLETAFQDPRITYICAAATSLPFPHGHFQLITLGCGLHWFDSQEFFRESFRLLAPGGLLAVYNHGFLGEMACNPDFSLWHNRAYLQRFPAPPRMKNPPLGQTAEAAGFQELGSFEIDHYWPFTPDELVSYLITQSNVLAHHSASQIKDVRTWIASGTAPFFLSVKESFRFMGRGNIWHRPEN